jgi:hypothetical protein
MRTEERMPDITQEQLDDILFFAQESKIEILYPFLLLALGSSPSLRPTSESDRKRLRADY